MIDGIGSTYQSLQGLQASRTFNPAGKSASVFRQALAAELKAAPVEEEIVEPKVWTKQTQSAPLPELAQPQRKPDPQLESLVHEVRHIAETTGYIGVSPQDILRAYQLGQSFLADYRV